MSSKTKWKDALLKSGLPLEHEVKTFLEQQKECLIRWEPSYFRHDDSGIEKEFSYDLNAAYIKMPYSVDFMVECKFRSEGVKWFFVPEEYGGMEEIYQNSFMNAIDYFHQWTWVWNQYMPYTQQLAPLCSKGIEIYPNGDNNSKSIRQAISQLSYALAGQMIEIIKDHIDEKYGIHFREIFIPIIVTTAELFRFNENLTVEDIKKCDTPKAISTKHDILIVKRGNDLTLYNHNMNIFNSFLAGRENILEKKAKCFTSDMNHLFHVISKNYCPQALVIVHHSQDNEAFMKLFEYIDKFIFPSKELLEQRVSYKKSLAIEIEALKTLKKVVNKKVSKKKAVKKPKSNPNG